MIRSLLGLLTALLILSGCGGSPPGGITEPRTTTVTEEQAIEFAKDAVRQNDSFADSATYSATAIGNGWQINVVDEDSDAFRMIILDTDGGVLEYNR